MTDSLDYSERQAQHEAEYIAACAAATPEQRAAMERAGIVGPHLDRCSKALRDRISALGLTISVDENTGRETTCIEGDATALFSNSIRTSVTPVPPESRPDEL